MINLNSTSFTLDNMGRYLCNNLQEALDSARQKIAGQTREFDVIIIGGGTFGSVIAQHLLFNDTTHDRRILVLEQGPFVLPEHVQNLPFLGGGLPAARLPWAVPQGSDYRFPGLTYAIGGRSLHWGGWSPELLHDAINDEMKGWIPKVIKELQDKYFQESSDQLGVSNTNDFISGTLHEGLRRQLFDGLQAGSTVGGALAAFPLRDLPESPIFRAYVHKHSAVPSDAQIREWLNLPSTDPTPRADLLNLLKLEAPLAVQSRTEPGDFPFNKFSAIPLLIKAVRSTSVEADGIGAEADSRRRLMVVPNTHVRELVTETLSDNSVRVTGVRVSDTQGNTQEIRLAPPKSDGRQGVVMLALGTIESTRIALTTFKDSLGGRAAQRMGQNLMVHLRSNLNIRIPRTSLTKLPLSTLKSLETSALFVKGKANIGGSDRYFHLQITASGLSKLGKDAEAELFKKIPDLDQMVAMQAADDKYVVITIRGIGEMEPNNLNSKVGIAQTAGDIDFGGPKAYAMITPTANDNMLWSEMDRWSDQVAIIFANGAAFELIAGERVILIDAGNAANQLNQLQNKLPYDQPRRDFLGTTHHETGTMQMSTNPADGVTDEYGKIHDTQNCYVLGPALFPTIGSPNPMLTGVALSRRTADDLTNTVLPKSTPFIAASGFRALFDGTEKSFKQWVRVSPDTSNGFALINGEIVTYDNFAIVNRDIGLLYYATEAFTDFTLRVQFRISDTQNHNSGIFVRFRNPLLDPPQVIRDRINAEEGKAFPANRALGAVHSGFEIQVDDNARGDKRKSKDFYGISEPDGLWKNRTGAIYKIPAGDSIMHLGLTDAKLQNYQPAPNLIANVWYEYEIDVRGNSYTVDLTNLDNNLKVRTTTFSNTDTGRGVASENGQAIGFIGLQSYANAAIAFRNIQIKP